MDRSPFSPEPGLLIAGRYRLLRPLGSGASAYVWAAKDIALGRDVAVKLLSGSIAQGGGERERLRREARLLALLDHPRITTVYDYVETVESGETGAADRIRNPMLVTELLQGIDLGTRLKQGPLPVRTALEVCAEIADALGAAHRAGIVHRDVKPGNVMLTDKGAKLLDFGISRRDTDVDLTGALVIGTPSCMAPEQWRGLSVGPAADIYGLGCLLFWCLSGRAPYPEREMPALGLAHLLEEPPALPERAGVTSTVAELYQRCMRKDAAGRPSARDVARVLTFSVAKPRATAFTPSRTLPVNKVAKSRVLGTRPAVVALAVALIVGAGVGMPLMLADVGGSGGSAKANSSTSAIAASHAASGSSDTAGGSTGISVVADVRQSQATGAAAPPHSHAPVAAPNPAGGSKQASNKPGPLPTSTGSPTPAPAGSASQSPAPSPSQPTSPAVSASPSAAAGASTQPTPPAGAPGTSQ
jgi:serine/threonine protein kinase